MLNLTPFQSLYGIYRFLRIKLLRDRTPFACSLAPTSRCNLKCSHCYEQFNRIGTSKPELTVHQMIQVVESLYKRGVRHCTITDGEPLLSRLSREKCEVIANRFWITWLVTNGTFEFPDLPVLYIVSLDGPKAIHDAIRGKGVYDLIRKNMKSAPSDRFMATCTLTTVNHRHISETVQAASELGFRGIVFNWYTPFSENDPLWVPYIQRNTDIDMLIRHVRKEPDFILNTRRELDLLRSPEWTVRCPNWCTISIDAFGHSKRPCVLGSRAVCEKCGCHVFPSLIRILERAERTLLLRAVEI
ncbi:MAG: radical SAM protein [Promethearchaeota archaeon]